ncbi:MAG: LLM class flavin-dependent oxidoreductase [Bacteroidetes bacterium]|nr:LLM class flavin-dependent oxidoreductase [Bacteroidota bacterium]
MSKIGILEFGLREPSASPAQILQDVMNYCISADQLGFSRFWLSEHHNLSPAWNNPEMLLPVLAGLTENIRVGIGGILLSMYSPYRVALTYKLLNTMYPGRIDLGLANGSVSYRIAQLLSNDVNIRKDFRNGFDDKLIELARFLRIEGLYYDEGVMITPYPGDAPEIWNLRSSLNSLPIAMDLQINFSLSLTHEKVDVHQFRDGLLAYREEYFSRHNNFPKINFLVCGICHKDSQKARKEYVDMGFDESKYPYNCIVGSPALFHEELSRLEELTQVDEFILHNLSYSNANKIDSLEMLSDTFELTGELARGS